MNIISLKNNRRKLNPRQQRFVDAYIETGSGSSAYRLAGYKEGDNHSVSTRTFQLMANMGVREAIDKRRAELRTEWQLTMGEKKAILTDIALYGVTMTEGDNPQMIDTNNSVRAIVELNRMDGDYASKGSRSAGNVTFIQEFDKTENQEPAEKPVQGEVVDCGQD